jgi:thioredoxin reductase (NADPH)
VADYDIAVVGAGAAGLTAARHAAAGGARTVVLDRLGPGGQVATVEGITNFPGRPEPIAGYDLGAHLMDDAEAAGAEVMLAEATGIDEDPAGGLVLAGPDVSINARVIIIAAGSARRSLGVVGEERLEGRGVSHCASCDGPFFQNKRVVVVGGGDSALDEAQVLAGFAAEVLIVHDEPGLTAAPEIITRTAEHVNVHYRPHATVGAIHGDDMVESVMIHDLATGGERVDSASGVFVYIGLSPNTEWLAGVVDLTGTGHIVVDADLATSRRRVFAAGDIRAGSAATLADSVRDGERAARAALTQLGLHAYTPTTRSNSASTA